MIPLAKVDKATACSRFQFFSWDSFFRLIMICAANIFFCVVFYDIMWGAEAICEEAIEGITAIYRI